MMANNKWLTLLTNFPAPGNVLREASRHNSAGGAGRSVAWKLESSLDAMEGQLIVVVISLLR